MDVVPDLRKGEWNFTSGVDVGSIAEGRFPLSHEQQVHLNELIDRLFANVDPLKLGCTSWVEHVIETDSPPIKQRYYPISPVMKVVNEELDKMLAQDVIERCNSPWSSPILLIPKRDKTILRRLYE